MRRFTFALLVATGFAGLHSVITTWAENRKTCVIGQELERRVDYAVFRARDPSAADAMGGIKAYAAELRHGC